MRHLKRAAAGYARLWRDLTGRRAFLFTLLHFTLLFLALVFFVFSPFRENGKSFVWEPDGMTQHIVRLEYISTLVRGTVRDLLAGKGWTFPAYDFRSGLVRQDLQMGFPQILAALFPEDATASFYPVGVLLGYYLAGAAFTAMGSYFGKRPLPVLTGAVCYAFCGFALYAGVRHPHFLAPMFYLPLLITGAEQVLRGRRAPLLTAAVFLSLTAQWGLYFSCMQAVLVFLFFVVRSFDLPAEGRGRAFAGALGRLLLWGGTGVLLAGAVAVPSLLAMTDIGRIGKRPVINSLLHYARSYYKVFFTHFTMLVLDSKNWTVMGFAAVSVPAVLLLFLRRERRTRTLRLLFLLLTALLCVPAAGYVLSGFSNVSNRFCFGYALCVSAIITFELPEFPKAPRRTAAAAVALTAAYAAVWIYMIRGGAGFGVYAGVTLLTVAALAFFTVARRAGALFGPACLLLAVLSVAGSSRNLYAPDRGGYAEEFIGVGYDPGADGSYPSLAESGAVRSDGEFFRVTGDSNGISMNLAFRYGLNGLTMYPYYGWSTAFFDWISELELPRNGNSHVISGLDTHAIPLSLAGVKYYAMREGASSVLPYGFSEVDRVRSGEHTDVILRNENALPVGYTYTKWIPREKYDRLSSFDRQEAQLRAVVLEEAPGRIGETDPEAGSAVRIPSEVVSMDGLSWEDGVLRVERADASVTLRFDGLPGAETALRIVDLDLTDGRKSTYFWVTASAGGSRASANFMADAHTYAHGQHTQSIDLGRRDEGITEIRLSFPQKGTFRLGGLEVWCRRMEEIPALTAALREEALENVTTDRRSLRGTISVSGDRFLCVALPYMDGWTAYLDGAPVKLYRANTAFMGIEVPAGDHTVELRYRLPGLLPGLAMTCAGLLSVAAYAAVSARRRGRRAA